MCTLKTENKNYKLKQFLDLSISCKNNYIETFKKEKRMQFYNNFYKPIKIIVNGTIFFINTHIT